MVRKAELSDAELARLLAATPAVDCGSSLRLRSSLHDGELTAAEARIAEAHLVGCVACQAQEAAWTAAEAAIARLPLARPSERVDAAMARLARPSRVRRLAPALPMAGLRLAAAIAVAVALVVGLQPGAAPQQARPAPATTSTLVAGVQIVLYNPTSTYYVLQPAAAAVDAISADGYQLRARIAVGGTPSSLALNERAARVLVLDASAKSLTEIDAHTNSVVARTAVPVEGTPTSVSVDPASGKVVVTSITSPGGAGGARPLPTVQPGGQVALIDPSTKQLDVITNVDVAPQRVVPDPQGKGALLLSSSASTLVDASFRTLRKLPGGIGAAYGANGWLAILGSDASGAVLTLVGDGAPDPIRLDGAPRALTPLPDGGFAVLVGKGQAGSRIVVIDASGAAVGVTPVDDGAKDLSFDREKGRFAVAVDGGLVSAALPAGIVARGPTASAPASPRALPSAPPAIASPSASPSASPAASPAPSLAPQPAQPALPAGVPPSARAVGDRLYHVGSAQALVTATSGERQWYVDARGTVSVLELRTGLMREVAKLPAGAEIRAITASGAFAYALDATAGRIFTIGEGGVASTWQNASLRRATGVVATPYALYVALSDPGQLARFDGAQGITAVVDAGVQRIERLAALGTVVWFTDDSGRLGRYDARAGRLTVSYLPAVTVTALVPDSSERVWIGTTAGEILAVDGGTARTVFSAGGVIVALALDPAGDLWYVATSPISGARFIYAPVLAKGTGRLLPGPATSLSFSSAWRAWLADPAGGFYLGAEQGGDQEP